MELHLVVVTVKSLQFLDILAPGTNLTLYKAIILIHHANSPDCRLFLTMEELAMRPGTHTLYAHLRFANQA